MGAPADPASSASTTQEPRRRTSDGSEGYTNILPSTLRSHPSDTAIRSTAGRRFSDSYYTDPVGDEIGSGSFSKVYKCFHRLTNRAYAVKTIEVSKCTRNNSPSADVPPMTTHSAAMQELRICSALGGCPGVLKFHEAFEEMKPPPDSDNGFIFAVFDLAWGGELAQVVSERGSLAEDDARSVMKSVLRACAGMHRRGVVHRDIKLGNILLLHDKGVFNRGVELADLGMAAMAPAGSHELRETCGTPLYMAPEIIQRLPVQIMPEVATSDCVDDEVPAMSEGYGQEVDVWSCGVVLHTLLCGSPPFDCRNCRQLFKHILRKDVGFEDAAWETVSSEAKDLVKKCLTKVPADRITAEEALMHPWLLQAHPRGLYPSRAAAPAVPAV